MHVNARAIIERDGPAGPEVYLQWRSKPGEPRVLELPGGRVEEYESILDALRREVAEETGFVVTSVGGEHDRVRATTAEADVECLPVFAAYQTLRGAIDSFGVYLRCRVEASGDGAASDESERGGWFDLGSVRRVVDDPAAALSWVDRAGLLRYLDAVGR